MLIALVVLIAHSCTKLEGKKCENQNITGIYSSSIEIYHQNNWHGGIPWDTAYIGDIIIQNDNVISFSGIDDKFILDYFDCNGTTKRYLAESLKFGHKCGMLNYHYLSNQIRAEFDRFPGNGNITRLSFNGIMK